MSAKKELKGEQLSAVTGGDEEDLMKAAAETLRQAEEERLRKQLEELQNQQATRNSEELEKQINDLIELLRVLTGSEGTGKIVVG